MNFPVELFINALIAGILLGGFYAAVTVGVSISFGILDIVNIAHPAFIILGSYIAYIVNQRLGVDPILTAILVLPFFYALGAAVYQVYYLAFEKRVGGGRTRTSVARLGDRARVEEISRMLGGAGVTDRLRDSAREMLGRCQIPQAKGEMKSKGESESRRPGAPEAR